MRMHVLWGCLSDGVNLLPSHLGKHIHLHVNAISCHFSLLCSKVCNSVLDSISCTKVPCGRRSWSAYSWCTWDHTDLGDNDPTQQSRGDLCALRSLKQEQTGAFLTAFLTSKLPDASPGCYPTYCLSPSHEKEGLFQLLKRWLLQSKILALWSNHPSWLHSGLWY